jgi:hypothetical protein
MGEMIYFNQKSNPFINSKINISPEETIQLLNNSIEIESQIQWRFLRNLNLLLGYNDIPEEMSKLGNTDKMGELMDITYNRVRLLKENAYEYHLAMCKKDEE